jgi:hypothetical protein
MKANQLHDDHNHGEPAATHDPAERSTHLEIAALRIKAWTASNGSSYCHSRRRRFLICRACASLRSRSLSS